MIAGIFCFEIVETGFVLDFAVSNLHRLTICDDLASKDWISGSNESYNSYFNFGQVLNAFNCWVQISKVWYAVIVRRAFLCASKELVREDFGGATIWTVQHAFRSAPFNTGCENALCAFEDSFMCNHHHRLLDWNNILRTLPVRRKISRHGSIRDDEDGSPGEAQGITACCRTPLRYTLVDYLIDILSRWFFSAFLKLSVDHSMSQTVLVFLSGCYLTFLSSQRTSCAESGIVPGFSEIKAESGSVLPSQNFGQSPLKIFCWFSIVSHPFSRYFF